MASINVKVIGAKEAENLVKEAAKVPVTVNNKMGETIMELRNLWRLNMPHDTGFLKESVFAGVVGKGKAKASTMTFLKKSEGYAIFPELARDGKAYTRPHYTDNTVREFAVKWEAKILALLDEKVR